MVRAMSQAGRLGRYWRWRCHCRKARREKFCAAALVCTIYLLHSKIQHLQEHWTADTPQSS